MYIDVIRHIEDVVSYSEEVISLPQDVGLSNSRPLLSRFFQPNQPDEQPPPQRSENLADPPVDRARRKQKKKRNANNALLRRRVYISLLLRIKLFALFSIQVLVNVADRIIDDLVKEIIAGLFINIKNIGKDLLRFSNSRVNIPS